MILFPFVPIAKVHSAGMVVPNALKLMTRRIFESAPRPLRTGVLGMGDLYRGDCGG